MTKEKEQTTEKLMGYGLAEVQAIEVFNSRTDYEVKVILDFLFFYGNDIAK